jgi:hypothetical protein
MTGSRRARNDMTGIPHQFELAQRARRVGTSARWLVAAVILGVLGGGVSDAQEPAQDGPSIESRLDTLFGSHEAYHKFLTDLQHAVAARDRNQIAGMVSYPLKTRIAGTRVSLAKPQQFLAHFDELLPQKSLDAISAQTFAGLFANSQGVMIGSGEVWFSGVCKAHDCNAPPIMITAVNPQP